MTDKVRLVPTVLSVIRGKLRLTLIAVSDKRHKVPVKNAYKGAVLPELTAMEVALATQRGVVPLEEVSYFLMWANHLTMSRSEDTFDYPTAEFIKGMLGAVLRKYSQMSKQDTVLLGEKDKFSFQGIPREDLVSFFSSLEGNNDREQIIQSLDNFVGEYL